MTSAPTAPADPPLRNTLIRIAAFLLAWIIVLAGAGILSYAMSESTRRIQNRHSVASEKRSEAAYGTADFKLGGWMIGIGLVAGGAAMLLKRWPIQLIGWSALVLPTLAIVGYSWLSVAPVHRHLAWQRNLANAMRAKFGSAKLTEDSPVLRSKLLIWDCTTDEPNNSSTRERATAADPEFTMVLVVDSSEKEAFRYRDGTPGMKRLLKVIVVDWPEEKLVGVYEVEGDPPPEIQYVNKDWNGPLVGEVMNAMNRWIDAQSKNKKG